MPIRIPLKAKYDTTNQPIGLSEFEPDDVLPPQHGGTGTTSLSSLVDILSPILVNNTAFINSLSDVFNTSTSIPSQTNNANKVLSTNGVTLEWRDVNELIDLSFDLGSF